MKDWILDYLIIGIIFVFIGLMLFLDIKFPSDTLNEEKHECTTFVKYKEHYQITPMTWYYRDSFKCIECGRDYKE